MFGCFRWELFSLNPGKAWRVLPQLAETLTYVLFHVLRLLASNLGCLKEAKSHINCQTVYDSRFLSFSTLVSLITPPQSDQDFIFLTVQHSITCLAKVHVWASAAVIRKVWRGGRRCFWRRTEGPRPCYSASPGTHEQDGFSFSSSVFASSLSNHLAMTDLLSKMNSNNINQRRKFCFPSVSHFLLETDLDFIRWHLLSFHRGKRLFFLALCCQE